MPIIPGAEPFVGGEGPVGVLVTHGFTGSPYSVRPWAQRLVSAGYRVRAPRLPGHGTRWQDLNLTRWQDWYGEVERNFRTLQGECDQVFGAGLSVGGALTLRLAEQEPALAGAILVNPSLATERRDAPLARLLQWVVPSFPGITNDIKQPGGDERGYDRLPLKAVVSLQQLWGVVLRDLERVRCPVRLYRSRTDHVVEPKSAQLLAAGLPGSFEQSILENSYHVATLDNDAPIIFDGSVQFIRSHSRAGGPPP